MCAIHRWIIIFIVSLLRVAVADLCGKDWKFHEKTFTCMKLVKEGKNFQNSNQYCEDAMGHLVYIFDKDTDDFVIGLLKKGFVTTARIGLNDAVQNGNYFWHAKSQEIPMSYKNWNNELRLNDSDKSTVTTSRIGWEEFDRLKEAYFVCQTEAELSKPAITCPNLVQENKETNCNCSVNLEQNFTLAMLSFAKLGNPVASINSTYVYAPGEYNITFEVKSNTAAATLVVKSVNRSCDNTSWTCSVKYNNSKETSSPNSVIRVYAVPSNVVCSYSFTPSGINLTCSTTYVYPLGRCSFYLNGQVMGYSYVLPSSGQTLQCTLFHPLTSAGQYNITVHMYPVTSLTEIKNNGSVVSRNMVVVVETPTLPPILHLNGKTDLLPDSLTVTENTTISLSCSVTGGQPPVYRTLLTCDNRTEPADGVRVSADFLVTRVLHKTYCTCWAQHIAGYNKQTIITLFVKFPSAVKEMVVRHNTQYTDIYKGNEVRISCQATGYPPPQVSLYDPEERPLNTTESESSYTFTATCHSAGTYKCRAENTVDGNFHQNERTEQIKIRCFPEHCDTKQTVPELGVAVSEEVDIRLCVVTNPLYPQVKLYQGNITQGTELRQFKYFIKYIDEVRQQAMIHIVMKLDGAKDLGLYKLCGHNNCQPHSRILQFRLIAKGPPICPTNFSAIDTDSRSVVLSWIPGFDGGRPQNFTILQYQIISKEEVIPVNSSSSSPMPSFERSNVAQIPHNNNVEMIYNITGLTAGTTHKFGIQASNDVNTTDCPHLFVTITTQAFSSAMSGNSSVVNILIPVIVCLILILVLVVVVVRRRRRQQKSLDVPVHQAGSTPEASRHEVTTTPNNEQGTEVTYYNTSKSVTTEEPVYINKYPQEELNTYAQVVKPKKVNKAKQLFGKKKQQLEDDNGYIRCDQREGAPKLNNKQNNAEYEMYANTAPRLDNTDESQDKLYSNSAALNPNKKKPPKPERKIETAPTRTVTDDGLIYIDVEINKKTSNPVLLEGNKTGAGPTPRKVGPVTQRPPADVVEYMAVDFTAGRTTPTELADG